MSIILKGTYNKIAEWFIKSKFDHYDNFVQQVAEELIDQMAANIMAIYEA